MGHYVIPPSRKILPFKFTDYNEKVVKVYDLDRRVRLERILHNYYVYHNIHYMSRIIERTKGTNKRNTEFLDDIYWMEGIHKYWKVQNNF